MGMLLLHFDVDGMKLSVAFTGVITTRWFISPRLVIVIMPVEDAVDVLVTVTVPLWLILDREENFRKYYLTEILL